MSTSIALHVFKFFDNHGRFLCLGRVCFGIHSCIHDSLESAFRVLQRLVYIMQGRFTSADEGSPAVDPRRPQPVIHLFSAWEYFHIVCALAAHATGHLPYRYNII